ncbi:MAG: isocitrate/isopropylmalate dehydrogenase family protein [Gammaproteobacteria bacterium]
MGNPKEIVATLIRGDGIGPEIMEAVLRVLEAVSAPFRWDEQTAGMAALKMHGDPLPAPVLEGIRKTKLALKGPLTTPVGSGFRSVNVRLREAFKLFANVRPARTYLPGGRYEDIDIVLIRENTQGFYVGFEHVIPIDDDPRAAVVASGINTRSGCRRIAEFAFSYAVSHGRKKITIVHKANILKLLTGLFLETAQDVGKKYAGQIEVEERIVDNCAMQLVLNPHQFDMILTTNMFGDILSDEIAGLVGGLGLAPGGNIGVDAAIFEAVHGSAPDIAGQGIANPSALLLASAMMLDYVGENERAQLLRGALYRVVHEDRIWTKDLGGATSTHDFASALITRL